MCIVIAAIPGQMMSYYMMYIQVYFDYLYYGMYSQSVIQVIIVFNINIAVASNLAQHLLLVQRYTGTRLHTSKVSIYFLSIYPSVRHALELCLYKEA